MDWIDIKDELPEEGADVVTAANFDNTGTPLYDLVSVTGYLLADIESGKSCPFSHWCELLPPDFDGRAQ